ncbi:MAG: RluA family pseudouridine synthase [Treponema sp.]|nr:RluA family pseudouridine synthase [Treponema sp.]
MIYKDFYAGKNDDNRRLDKVLRIFIKDIPLSSIYKFIRKGLIKVNDKKTSQEYRVNDGDKISIAEFIISSHQEKAKNNSDNKKSTDNSKTLDTRTYKNTNTELPPIVFENDNIIIFNKPINLSVHGSNTKKMSLEQLYKNHYFQSPHSNDSLSFCPGPLHRIDRMTSGLIAFSKSIDGARWFSQAVKNHQIQKKYLAILSGKLSEKCEWIDYIDAQTDSKNKDSKTSKKQGFHTVRISSSPENSDNSNFKEAASIVTPLAFGKYKNQDITLAEIQIKTGRHHQIRSQCALHSFPLLFDTAYTKSLSQKEHFFLHARTLLIPQNNPIGLPEKIEAPLPEEFIQFLSKTCDIKSFDI